MPEATAKAAAAEVAMGQEFASKADLLEMRAEFEKRFAAVEQSLAIVKFAVLSGGSVMLALLLKLVFLP